MSEVSPNDGPVRTAEVIAAVCLATDLEMGFPFEHGLHTTVIASRLAERLGVDRATATGTYYACLLSHSGCTRHRHCDPLRGRQKDQIGRASCRERV